VGSDKSTEPADTNPRMKAFFRSEMILAALVGALISAVCAPLTTNLVSRYKAEARLELVALDFVEDPRTSRIDIKLRNIGERPAFLRELHAQVERIWSIDPLYVPKGFQASGAEYVVILPNMATPYTVTTPLSQVIQPNDVDRFGVVLQAQGGPNDDRHYFFLLRLTLLYNEFGRLRTSESLLLASGPRHNLEMMYVNPGVPREVLDSVIPPEEQSIRRFSNWNTVADLERHKALRSPLAEELIHVLSMPVLKAE